MDGYYAVNFRYFRQNLKNIDRLKQNIPYEYPSVEQLEKLRSFFRAEENFLIEKHVFDKGDIDDPNLITYVFTGTRVIQYYLSEQKNSPLIKILGNADVFYNEDFFNNKNVDFDINLSMFNSLSFYTSTPEAEIRTLNGSFSHVLFSFNQEYIKSYLKKRIILF